MKIEQTPIKALRPYAGNARTHSEPQIMQIAESIRTFGWTNPILIADDGEIIAGHGRVEAAKKLKLDKVPTIKLSHLTDVERRAYVLADNKLALNAGWDDELLRLELQGLIDEGFDAALTGFDTDELDKILDRIDVEFGAASEDDQSRLDRKKPHVCPACGHEWHE